MGYSILSCGCRIDSHNEGILAKWQEEVCEYNGYTTAIVYGIICEEHFKSYNAKTWEEDDDFGIF